MQAVCFKQINEVEPRELADPTIESPGDVIVCFTDGVNEVFVVKVGGLIGGKAYVQARTESEYAVIVVTGAQ